MSDVRATVLEIQKRAAGINLSMSKLRDAIAIALWNRPYAAAKAAENHGQLVVAGALTPAYLDAACARFGLAKGALDALFGSSSAAEATRDEASDGLRFELQRLEAGDMPLLVNPGSEPALRPAYVTLTHDGRVGVGVQELISEVDPTVSKNQTIRWFVHPATDGAALKSFLEQQGRPLLATVHRGHRPIPDASHPAWLLTEEAEAARLELLKGLELLKRHDLRWPVEYLFIDRTKEPRWGDSLTLAEHVRAVEERASQDGVSFVPGESIENILAEAALEIWEEEPELLSRTLMRDLAVRGMIDVGEYAEWIAEHADGADPDESEKDRGLDLYLDIHDSGASDAECRAGVRAAEAALAARGITKTQAYIAMLLDANGAPFIADHRAAWDAAETAAFTAAFEGWVMWPEHAVLSVA